MHIPAHPFAAFELKLSFSFHGLYSAECLSLRCIMASYPDPFSQPHCVVLVLQHYYKCCSSLLVFATADPTCFTVWECPMPWHSLCFPQAYGLCTEALPGEVQMDPYTFLRKVGSWQGKVLFCFPGQDGSFMSRSFTDVWSWCPLDPLPLVPWSFETDPRNPVLVRGDPLWTCCRRWGISDPMRFWQSTEQQYLCTEKAFSLHRKLDELMTATSGLKPICRLFEPPPLPEMSVIEEETIYRINFSLYPIFD